MALQCGPGRWVSFRPGDRDYVVWGSTGLTDAAVVTGRLEAGDWFPLDYNTETGEITGYFARAEHQSPGSAHIVSATSHVDIHIVDDGVDRTVDGGFIRLVP